MGIGAALKRKGKFALTHRIEPPLSDSLIMPDLTKFSKLCRWCAAIDVTKPKEMPIFSASMSSFKALSARSTECAQNHGNLMRFAQKVLGKIDNAAVKSLRETEFRLL